MAINVNTVYQTVLSILNKESRGFLTPDEFKRIGAQVQLDILDRNFHDYNRAVIKQNAGRFVEDYGNIPEKLEQKIDVFYKANDLTLSNGKVTIPADLYKTINISITNKTIQLEKVDKKSLSYLLSSPLTKPTTSFPVYYQTDTEIITNPSLTGSISIEYIKVPSDPVWNSTADSNGALTYNSSGSTDFTLHESDRVELIIGILKYAGLVISDPTVVQAAGGEESKTIQLQNS
jgi:uncharacterized membrane protein|tara:strand:- start:2450 stop:3148 length:699 start_codon:yes stop_codon:yes gene_type:complete